MVNTTLKSNNQLSFSEADMAIAFRRLLQSRNGLPEIGPFDGVFEEISCRQGRPDFIALRNLSDERSLSFPTVTGLVGPSILSILKPVAPRTFDYIVQHSEFSTESIRKSLRYLLETKHIVKTKSGSYHLGRASVGIHVEIWSFELKLNNAKRAVFQAQQSRAFAERSIIVVPPGKEANYVKFEETMNRWGIGLATFSPLTMEFNIVRKGRKAKALSRTHQIYALSQIGV